MSFLWTASGRLSADGKGLEYACFGPAPKDAPTLVLLHEGLGSTKLWRDFPAALAKATGFGVFTYSRAGYGQSDLAETPRSIDYMTHEATKVLPEILRTIGFKRGLLIGHSDGATIAAIFAGSIADHRVRGIVLMAPHFFAEEMGLSAITQAKKAYETGDLRQRLAKYHNDPDHTFYGWNEAWLNPKFKSWNVSDVIDYIRIPVLAIQGREDQYGTLAQIEELANRCYSPVDQLILDECRHAPFLDQGQKVVSTIADFCSRLERIEAAVPELA